MVHQPEHNFSRQNIMAADAGVASAGAITTRGSGKVALSEAALAVASHFSDRPISPVVLVGLVRMVDFLVLMVCGLAIYFYYLWPAFGLMWQYVPAIVIGSALCVFLMQAFDGYNVSAFRVFFIQFGRIFLAWTMVFAFFALAVFFTKTGADFSRLWLGSWYAGGLALMALGRAFLTQSVVQWTRDGRLERRAVIVGGGDVAADLINSLENQRDNDIRICGVFDDRKDDRSPEVVAGYPKLGTVDELIEFSRITRLDMLIVALPLTAEKRVLQMLRKLWVLPLDVRLSAHTNKLRFRPRSYSYIGSVPFLDVLDKPIADWDSLMKRLFDISISLAALALLSPVMIATAIAVKATSRGPVLFRQNRYGFNNELIGIYKFRSMYTDMCDANATRLVTKGDPRVTPVGRFIRRTSIDELPQLFNVLRGELSLVGPRPHATHAKAEDRLYDEVVDSYFARHKVKPGITGWAQINGWRGETDTAEKIQKRVEHDIYYIENWSLLFDLYIVAATPFSLIKTENAY